MRREFVLDGNGPPVRVRTKVWLEVDGEILIGEGRARLLRLIHETGSINAAARSMGISFRRAWAMLRDIEGRLRVTLVEKRRGGVGGGRATLTPAALLLLERYDEILREFESLVSR